MTRPRSASGQTLAWSAFAVILAAGAAVVLISVARTVRFLPDAPREFWLLSVVALLVELSPLTIPHDRLQPSRVAVSLCPTFAIFLLWGSPPAIVVQALALSVAALQDRRQLTDFAFGVARFSLAFQVAGWAEDRVGHPPITVGIDVGEFGIASVVVTALVWILVDFGVIALLLSAGGRPAWLKWAGSPLYHDLAATGALLMLAPLFITAPTGWGVALLAVPLALFSQVSRVLWTQERNLNRDPVTQLQNTRGLSVSMDRLLTATSPTSDPARLAFLLVRLDGLGEVQNVFGRLVTDRLLVRIGERLTADTASEDAVTGRVAADFVVLLPRADVARAERVAGAVARGLLAPIDVDGVVFPVRPTIGIAMAPADGTEIGALTARAETAIMDAQRTGALFQTFQDSDEIEAGRRLSLLVDLRAAIEQPAHASELFELYQPQVQVEDGRLVGVEALVRWRHPERGLVDTTDMILTAEASGVMQLLTLRVIDDVLAQLAAWAAEGLRPRASVNVSAKDFASDQFAQQVQVRLLRHGVPPEQLELEVTESALVVSPSVDRNVADLVAMGVELSLDDFGTGFASLQQLRRYPLRELKIDRSYIAAMTTSSADFAVVISITDLATKLGLRVVAEGVEDANTAALLEQIGPVIGQGWYYGRPMSGPDLVAWIHARPGRT